MVTWYFRVRASTSNFAISKLFRTMRFAAVDSSSDGESVQLRSSDLSNTSSVTHNAKSGVRTRSRSKPRYSVLSLASHDGDIDENDDGPEDDDDGSEDLPLSEPDSEDEVEILGGKYEVIDKAPVAWQGTRTRPVVNKENSSPWRTIRNPPQRFHHPRSSYSEETTRAMLAEKSSAYETWTKTAEAEAVREGRHLAQERRGELRERAKNARTEVRLADDARLKRETEEMRRMIEGMALRRQREAEEERRDFAEREKRLWEEIDATILEIQRKEAEVAAAEAAAKKKAYEASKAAIARQEQEAQARRIAEHKVAEEARARQKRELDAQETARKLEEEARLQAEHDAKLVDLSSLPHREWAKWVKKQEWIKREVIEKVKADRTVKQGVKLALRLITRGVGQVVNTKHDTVRVTDDLHRLLLDVLPSSPSAKHPTSLSQPPPIAYSYLLSHLSKALIKQAESEVSAKPNAAFPLARIVHGLILRGHGALSDILMARLVKKCPWVIPFYPRRQDAQAREAYEKSTGRASDESTSEYIQRMGGILILYFAIIQTNLAPLIPTLPSNATPRQLIALYPPALRLTAAWTWMAYALRKPILASAPMASMLAIYVEVVAPDAAKVFGALQVGKVLRAMKRDCVERGKVKGEGEADRQRLGILIDKWEQQGAKYLEGREWET